MSDRPGPPGGFDPSGFGPSGFDPSALGAVFGQLQRIFSAPEDGGPVNWQLARETALEALDAAPPPGTGASSPSEVAQRPRIGFGADVGGGAGAGGAAGRAPAVLAPADVDAVERAAGVADLWLDAVTSFPAAPGRLDAWTPRQWVDKTLPTWRNLVTPVAARMAQAVTGAVDGAAGLGALPPGLPPEAAGLLAGAGPMLQRLGGGLLGIQLGQAVGGLAREVTGTFDVGYPLAGAGHALLPSAVRATAGEAGLPEEEVRLFAALRELAHARLFAVAGWLAPTLLSGIEGYAAGIEVDADRLREVGGRIDPTDPSSIQDALSSGVLDPVTSPAQQAALDRLELLLALVEGWVETVTGEAARGHLPHADALLEWQRRRRAVGGPAERTFGALVGLELRPRRMREAAQWWRDRGAGADAAARDAAWDHPDLLPEDLAPPSPAGSEAADGDEAGTDVDAELRRLLDEEGGGRGPAS